MASLGCMIAADLLNPGFLSAMGLNPAALLPSPGVVVVSFTNGSGDPGTFYAFEAASAQDYTAGARNFSVEVDPLATRNEVLECPIGAVSPGSLNESFAVQSVAAVLTTNQGEVTVDYEGSALVGGRDFFCGDLIDVQLVQVGEGYGISVQVRPGS
jgi:hypothetical protein